MRLWDRTYCIRFQREALSILERKCGSDSTKVYRISRPLWDERQQRCNKTVLVIVNSFLSFVVFKYEILFGEKKKRNKEGSISETPTGTPTTKQDGDQESEQDVMDHRNGAGNKKRVQRGFQQLLKKDQLSYIPPTLPIYQHGVNIYIHSRRSFLGNNDCDICSSVC